MKFIFRIFFIIFYLSSVYSYCQTNNLQYLTVIKDKKDFDLLKGKPLSNNYNGIECIKIVYELSNKTLYYIQSVKHTWHYSFTSQILHDEDDLGWFNTINYGQHRDRKYILATFNYNTNSKNYFLQFAPPDYISDELIAELVTKVSETFFKQTQFKVLLNTTTLLRRKKELSKKFNTITSDELYQSQKYQAIYSSKASGILLFINADSIKQSTDYSKNILVINGNSNNIPICKGIVTNQFQTPLSHISLLTMNRKIPCGFQKNVFDNDSLKKLNHQLVELHIMPNSLTIKSIKELTSTVKSIKKIILGNDTVTKSICYLKQLSYKNKKTVGSKAANLAELLKLELKNENIHTPPHAFAIPFYYYNKHLKTHGIQTEIDSLLSNYSRLKNDSILAIQLKLIRHHITKAPIDSSLLNNITKKCASHFGNKKVRFRSSSNCEDGDTFNGAGLYTSETGRLQDTIKNYERAIKKVWASLWTMRAFKERDYFNINHKQVLMGVLVHQAYDNELVNGVAITKNLYRHYEVGFVINIQKGEEEVVSPKAGVISEQIISYMNYGSEFYDVARSADWLSYSSIQPNESLLTTEELYDLTKQLEKIKRHFYELYHAWPKVNYQDFGMDVEFKLIETTNKQRQFIIKQARPYLN
jgi:hypothetical protein